MHEGLIKGEGFAVDASLMRANASEARAVDRGEPVDWSDPKIASRPVTEYLEAIDQEGAPRKKISLTDRTARWTAAVGELARFTWSTNYLLDIETSVIVVRIQVVAATHWPNRSAGVSYSRVFLGRSLILPYTGKV